MAIETSEGTRRFLEYANSRGYEPVETKSNGSGATTLVYATDKTYFFVFQRQCEEQRIPKKIIKNIIGKKYDVVKAFEEGKKTVEQEMIPGYMTPFVSENFTDFEVYLDKRTFSGRHQLIFPSGNNGDGFSLPANAVKDMLVGLYGTDKVHDIDFFGE